jgi:hypothetical protein
VYAAGASATPGAGLPFVGLSAALVATEVGPASGPGRGGDHEVIDGDSQSSSD